MATVVEKIIAAHLSPQTREATLKAGVKPGAIADVTIDVRAARDFGGPNVVKNIREQGLKIDDPSKTVFTFDCNPTGSDQKYAANQHICRMFARERGIKVYDIEQGIGTHIAIEKGMVKPGVTFVSTDSHANIMGSVGAFGQGMGDIDIAACWANGSVWFKVPKSAKITLKGKPAPGTLAKDVALHMAKTLGANGLLGFAAEVQGEFVDELSLAGRITIASMGTEMGAIILLFRPNAGVLEELGLPKDYDLSTVTADPGAHYDMEMDIDIEGLTPMSARPGHPDDAVVVSKLDGRLIDSAFIGSCTNGQIDDMRAAAAVLKGRHVAPGVVLKIVPSTRHVTETLMSEGLIQTFVDAGALVGNQGCAGCAAGQIGQNGPKEVTVSTGNRNFPGKQGKGEVYLASPATVAASAVAGCITIAADVDKKVSAGVPEQSRKAKDEVAQKSAVVAPAVAAKAAGGPVTEFEGRCWVIDMDNIDTDMIYHNSHLQVTDIKQMGQFAFGNLDGYEKFAKEAKPGDMLAIGRNFGCGSSRQHAVDCFKDLGFTVILAKSYGAIYERNAINGGFPILTGPEMKLGADGAISNHDIVRVNLETSEVFNVTKNVKVPMEAFSPVQMQIYKRGGLLCNDCDDKTWVGTDGHEEKK